jgi:hypothetical protein
LSYTHLLKDKNLKGVKNKKNWLSYLFKYLTVVHIYYNDVYNRVQDKNITAQNFTGHNFTGQNLWSFVI